MAYYNGKKILKKILVKGSNIKGVTEENNRLKIEGYENTDISIYDENKTIATAGNSNVNVNGDGSTININGDNVINNYASTVTLNTYGGSYVADNLAAENIKSGVNILGHTGTYEGSGGVTIPQVTNIQLSEQGVLTWDAPDITSLAKYNPTISYIIKINDFELTSTDTSGINISFYFREGINDVSIITKAVLNTASKDKENDITYSLPAQYVQILSERMPYVNNGQCAVPYGNVVYLFGGSGNTTSKQIQKFDTINKTFTVISSQLSGMYGYDMAGVLVNTDIYLFGSYFGSYKKTIAKFDILSETLTYLNATLPNGESRLKTGLLNNKIYLLSKKTSSIYTFDIETETITTLEITQPLYNDTSISLDCGSCQIGTNIYLFSGYSSLLSILIYKFDMLTETFELIREETEKLQIGYNEQSCVSIDDKIYIWGGNGRKKSSSGQWQTNTQWYSHIAVFDTTTLSFEILDIELWLATRWGKQNACVIDNIIYLFGGGQMSGQERDYITKIKV